MGSSDVGGSGGWGHFLERKHSARSAGTLQDVLGCGILQIPMLQMFKSELFSLYFLCTRRTEIGMYFQAADLFVLRWGLPLVR